MDHTPLPWSVDTVAGSDGDFEGIVDYRIVDSQNRTILDSYNSDVQVVDELGHVVHNAQGKTDLEFVVRACNNHDELVEAVRYAANVFGAVVDQPDSGYLPSASSRNGAVIALRMALAKATATEETMTGLPESLIPPLRETGPRPRRRIIRRSEP